VLFVAGHVLRHGGTTGAVLVRRHLTFSVQRSQSSSGGSQTRPPPIKILIRLRRFRIPYID